jgi:glucose-1-phosphate thymidylyltransferase
MDEMTTKGIILAGGAGTRLHPMTAVVSKQLLPIYDKPMIFYSLSTLMLARVRQVLLISTPEDTNRFEKLLGDGKKWGMSIEYAVQASPKGIAEAFIIGEDFIGEDQCMLILGDNLFFGNDLQTNLLRAKLELKGATVFGYPVKDPERYGVVEFDELGSVISIEEKPINPKSRHAVTGLYLYDKSVVEIAKNISPSDRGELEITSINQAYLNKSQLHLEVFGRGMTWLDTGTAESLMEAGEFVKVIQNRQGLVISCPEEISWRNGWISFDELILLAREYGDSEYKHYLSNLT